MARKLLIVLVNTDPRNPEELGALLSCRRRRHDGL
jgi:hypothetical protein